MSAIPLPVATAEGASSVLPASASFPATAVPASPSSADDARLEERILREQADLLIRSSWSSPISTFIVAAALWGMCWYTLREPGALVWAAMVHSSQIARLVKTLRYIRTPTAERRPLVAVRWYCRSLALTGVIWGLAPWLFYPTGSTPLLSLMIMIMLGNSSAAVVALAPYRPSIYCFIVPLLTGLAAALFWQGTTLAAAMGVGILVGMAAIVRFGLMQNTFLNQALRARYLNEALAARLAEQVLAVERASREKTRFFASASHDLRQPLHSLGLFGAALLARVGGTPDEPLARNLMHCVDALETSFSSMLDVSKLDAGVVAARFEPVALADVFRRVQASFGRHADAQNLSLRFRPGDKWVSSDAALLERLVGNLVHNALKFTTRGGVTVVARTRGDCVSLEVWDTGAGIDPAELPHIFEEFYQVGNRERDRAKGLGMGLAIVRRLSSLIDSKVEVRSTPGRGTVFRLTLPGSAPSAPTVAAPAPPGPVYRALAGLHVLVVDDEENVRTATAAALALYGVSTVTADGAAAAREAVSRPGSPVDFVVVDFRLRHHEDGLALVTELRALLGRELPALLVTGDTAPERVREAEASGLSVLYKPVKPDDLAEAMQLELTRAG